MESKIRSTADPVTQRLECVKEFSFFQLNDMLQRLSQQRQQKGSGEAEQLPLAIRYRALASLGFPASDVASCRITKTVDKEFLDLHVSFLGLYGPASPLPVYYTERVIQNSEADHPSRDFMDVFNHRMISLLQRCWDKYRYYCQYRDKGKDRYSRWFLSIAGIDVERVSQLSELRWHRLMPMVGILSNNVGSADLLARLIKYYFRLYRVEIKPWVARTVRIPADQCNSMGLAHCQMGSSLVLGEDIQDCSGKFELHLYGLSHRQYRRFLPGNPHYREVLGLVQLTQKVPLEFDLHLHPQQEATDLFLTAAIEQQQLGWSAVLGDSQGFEPTKVCVTDYGLF